MNISTAPLLSGTEARIAQLETDDNWYELRNEAGQLAFTFATLTLEGDKKTAAFLLAEFAAYTAAAKRVMAARAAEGRASA